MSLYGTNMPQRPFRNIYKVIIYVTLSSKQLLAVRGLLF